MPPGAIVGKQFFDMDDKFLDLSTDIEIKLTKAIASCIQNIPVSDETAKLLLDHDGFSFEFVMKCALLYLSESASEDERQRYRHPITLVKILVKEIQTALNITVPSRVEKFRNSNSGLRPVNNGNNFLKRTIKLMEVQLSGYKYLQSQRHHLNDESYIMMRLHFLSRAF